MSLSYSQEYVEIKGIKLGAPISEVADLDEYILQNKVDFIEELAVLDTYQKTTIVDGQPKGISLVVFEGNVESVNFAIAESRNLMDEHIAVMAREWGDPIRDSRERMLGGGYISIDFPSQSDLLYNIHLAHYRSPFENGTNVVESYGTKKYHDHMTGK